MSTITNDGLTRSDTGCFYSCTRIAKLATVGVKGRVMLMAVSFTTTAWAAAATTTQQAAMLCRVTTLATDTIRYDMIEEFNVD